MSNKRWDILLAEKFKERNNPSPIGAVLGKVISPLPNISIELLNGYGVIDKEKIYLSNAITNRLAIECTIKEFESQGNTEENGKLESCEIKALNSNGIVPTVINSHNGSISSLSYSKGKNSKENKASGKFILQTVFNLKPGMYVLVIPNEQEDKFFLIDVFNHSSEVSLEWEYYQK